MSSFAFYCLINIIWYNSILFHCVSASNVCTSFSLNLFDNVAWDGFPCSYGYLASLVNFFLNVFFFLKLRISRLIVFGDGMV